MLHLLMLQIIELQWHWTECHNEEDIKRYDDCATCKANCYHILWTVMLLELLESDHRAWILDAVITEINPTLYYW